jgi:hypothetical protein
LNEPGRKRLPPAGIHCGVLMYTLHMSWSFRALVLSVTLAWAIAPQVACFVPDQTLTKSEMDCCERMANDCGGANMNHACCRPVIRTDVGIAAKLVRDFMPQLHVAESTADFSAEPSHSGSQALPFENNHAPPPEPVVSSSILRI